MCAQILVKKLPSVKSYENPFRLVTCEQTDHRHDGADRFVEFGVSSFSFEGRKYSSPTPDSKMSIGHSRENSLLTLVVVGE